MVPSWAGSPPSDGVGKVIACATLSTRQRRPLFKPTRKKDIIAQPQAGRGAGGKSPAGTIAGCGADQGFSAQTPGGPLRVLLVIKCLGYGGAERLLVDMVAAVDRGRFDYEVAYVLRDQDALVPSDRGGRNARACPRCGPQCRPAVDGGPPPCAGGGGLRRGPLPPPVRGRAGPDGRGFPAPLRPTGRRVHRAQLVGPDEVRDQGVAACLDGKRRAAGHGVAGVPRRPPGTAATPGHDGGARRRPVPVGLPDGPTGRTAGRRAGRTRRGPRRAPLHDRGQPPTREGVRRVARCGPDHRRSRAPRPDRRGGTRPAERPPSTPVTSNWGWATGSSSSASATTCCSCWRGPMPSSWPPFTRGSPWR